jgi:hypothetical protein
MIAIAEAAAGAALDILNGAADARMPPIADLAADPEVKPIMDLELQHDHSAEHRGKRSSWQNTIDECNDLHR